MTSRLYKTLVEKGLAAGVDSSYSYPGERYPSLFVLEVVPQHGHSTDQLEEVVWKELRRLSTAPIEDWELQKVRAGLKVGLLKTLKTNGGMASALVYDQTIFGDWHYLLRFQDAIDHVSAGDVQKVANAIFQESNVTVAVLKTKHSEAPLGHR